MRGLACIQYTLHTPREQDCATHVALLMMRRLCRHPPPIPTTGGDREDNDNSFFFFYRVSNPSLACLPRRKKEKQKTHGILFVTGFFEPLNFGRMRLDFHPLKTTGDFSQHFRYVACICLRFERRHSLLTKLSELRRRFP